MLDCYQFPGMNVYEHGVSVHEWFNRLQKEAFAPSTTLRIPDWFKTIWKLHLFTWDCESEVSKEWETIRLYQIYHDCGKPLCRTVDAEGKQHFPNHAQVSYETWMKYAETDQDREVGSLIRMDMDAHCVKGDAIEEFIRRPQASVLVTTALAEIYSNASHLNALDSDRFKIKYKQIDKVGKRLLAYLNSK